MATWHAVIAFGMVNINVSFELATPERATTGNVSFKKVHAECMQPIKQPYTCEEHGLLGPGESARALEYTPNPARPKEKQYILVSDEAIEEITPEASRALVITSFVPVADIDAMYFDRSYYLVPKDSTDVKAYSLLYHAMRKQKVGGLCKYVRGGKEYLGFIRVMHGAIGLHTMYVFEDVRFPECELLSEKELGKAEQKMAQEIIAGMSGEFVPDDLVSEYRMNLAELVKALKTGEKNAEAKPKRKADTSLEEALKASVKQLKAAA